MALPGCESGYIIVRLQLVASDPSPKYPMFIQQLTRLFFQPCVLLYDEPKALKQCVEQESIAFLRAAWSSEFASFPSPASVLQCVLATKGK